MDEARAGPGSAAVSCLQGTIDRTWTLGPDDLVRGAPATSEDEVMGPPAVNSTFRRSAIAPSPASIDRSSSGGEADARAEIRA